MQQLVVQEGLELTGRGGRCDHVDHPSPGRPGALGLDTVLPGVPLVPQHIPGGLECERRHVRHSAGLGLGVVGCG